MRHFAESALGGQIQPAERVLDALRSEHLAEGVRPIMTSIVDSERANRTTLDAIRKIRAEGLHVDYADALSPEAQRGAAPEEAKYALSDLDQRDKYSTAYEACTGIIAVGVDRETGAQISFLSHQAPGFFLASSEQSEVLKRELLARFRALIDRAVPQTVDCVLFGGDYQVDPRSETQYYDSIRWMAATCQEALEFEPVVVTGPNLNTGEKPTSTSAYFDTQHRRLYLARPEQSGHRTNASYLPSQLEAEKAVWRGEKEKK